MFRPTPATTHIPVRVLAAFDPVVIGQGFT
jgi:hypothetical protein